MVSFLRSRLRLSSCASRSSDLFRARSADHLGVRAAATALDLSFVPVTWEDFDIVLSGDTLAAAEPLIAALRTSRSSHRSMRSAAMTCPGLPRWKCWPDPLPRRASTVSVSSAPARRNPNLIRTTSSPARLNGRLNPNNPATIRPREPANPSSNHRRRQSSAGTDTPEASVCRPAARPVVSSNTPLMPWIPARPGRILEAWRATAQLPA